MNLPARADLLNRARWLASLDPAERRALEELPIRDVEEAFRAWSAAEADDDGLARAA
ncbi:MAG: hypothetical protein U0237_05235 [Thermoleophilia bacterium]